MTLFIVALSLQPFDEKRRSVEQAEEMVTRWLSNRTRFCVSADFPFANSSAGGNGNISCYYGMPSISADDPSYCNGKDGHCGYWRGHTWGPLNTLTWWALSHPKYEQSAIVTSARKSLAKQAKAMLLSVWQVSRHVCENYAPYKQLVPACTGDPFYHWGGLNALLSLLEAENQMNATLPKPLQLKP